MRCAIVSSEPPRLVKIVLIRSFISGNRLRASIYDCLHNAIVGWMHADLTLSGMRSQVKVVAARVLPAPEGAALVRKCGTENLHRSLTQIAFHRNLTRTPTG